MNIGKLTFDYNLYGNGTSANITIHGPHDLFGDSKFVNSSLPNLQLQSSSAAINKASAWPGLTSDFAGNSRPSHGGYDIGAYQY